MPRNIAKPFYLKLSMIDITPLKPKYKCFYGEDVELVVDVIDEGNKPLDISETSAKVYYITNDHSRRQDSGITYDPDVVGRLYILVKRNYLYMGSNIIRVVLFDKDQEVYLQPAEIICLETGVGETPETPSLPDMDVKNEISTLHRIKSDLSYVNPIFDDHEERIQSITEHCTGGNGTNSHSHSNKTVIDSISNVKVAKWDNYEGLIKNNTEQLDSNTQQLTNHITNHPKGVEINDITTGTDKVYSSAKTKALVDEVASKGTTVEVINTATKTQIDKYINDGTIANMTIKAKSVDISKLTFAKTGKNLFDKNNITTGKAVSNTDGTLFNTGSFVATDFIPVIANERYTETTGSIYSAFYDINKVFIPFTFTAKNPRTIIAPANACFYRTSIGNNMVSNYQLENGESATSYENYVEFLKQEYLEDKPFNQNLIPNKAIDFIKLDSSTFDNVDDGAIKFNKTNFITVGKNLFNKNDVVVGSYLNKLNGILVLNKDYVTTDFMSVAEGQSYSHNKKISHYCFYDQNKTFLNGSDSVTTTFVTVPPNAKFMRISVYNANIETCQLETGTVSTLYEPYGYKFKYTTKIDFNVEMVLPKNIYGLVGEELNIYFDNCMNDRDTNYSFNVECTIGSQFARRYTVTPATAGSYPISIDVIKDNNVVFSTTSTLIITDKNVGNGVNKKVLIIGDSTTANSVVSTKLNLNFSDDTMDINLLGTKGTIPNVHEGISGWSTSMFYTNPNSPFVFDGVFNFTKYMQQNNYSSVDYVIINLGINDVFASTTDFNCYSYVTTMLTQYQGMINSIKSFNSNIKIGLAITIPCNYSQDAFAKDYYAFQTRDRCKRNNFLWTKELINTFTNKEGENIYLIPINLNIDTKYNFELVQEQVNKRNPKLVEMPNKNSGVHPGEFGYWQIADMYWYWIKKLEV